MRIRNPFRKTAAILVMLLVMFWVFDGLARIVTGPSQEDEDAFANKIATVTLPGAQLVVTVTSNAQEFNLVLDGVVGELNNVNTKYPLNYRKYPQLRAADAAFKKAIFDTAAKYKTSVPWLGYYYLRLPGFHILPGMNFFSQFLRLFSPGMELLFGIIAGFFTAFLGVRYYRREKLGLAMKMTVLRKELIEEKIFFKKLEAMIEAKNVYLVKNDNNALWIGQMRDDQLADLYQVNEQNRLKDWVQDLKEVKRDKNNDILNHLKRIERLAARQSPQMASLLQGLETVKRQWDAIQTQKIDITTSIEAEIEGLRTPTLSMQMQSPKLVGSATVPKPVALPAEVIAKRAIDSLNEIDSTIQTLMKIRDQTVTGTTLVSEAAIKKLGIAGQTIPTNINLKEVYEFLRHFHLLIKAEEVAIQTEIQAIEAIINDSHGMIKRIGLPAVVKIIKEAAAKKKYYYEKQREYRGYFDNLKNIYPLLTAWFESEEEKMTDVEFAAAALKRAASESGIVSYMQPAASPLLVKSAKVVEIGDNAFNLDDKQDEPQIITLEEIWGRVQKLRPDFKETLSDGAVWYLLGENQVKGMNDLALWVLKYYKNPHLANELNKLKRPSVWIHRGLLTQKPTAGDKEAPAKVPPIYDDLRQKIADLIDSAYSGILSKRHQRGAWSS